MMMVEGLIIDAGFLGIAGFGVWRGQSLWNHHIELKHEREMARLSMDRMEKSIKLEMEQTRNMAEMEQMKEMPALPEATLASASLKALPWLCNCGKQNGCWHVHAMLHGAETTFSLSVGAILSISEGAFTRLCSCDVSSNTIHTHGTSAPQRRLDEAGIVLRDIREYANFPPREAP
jgi:hypothetical protein